MWFSTQRAALALGPFICLALAGCAPEALTSARQSECVGDDSAADEGIHPSALPRKCSEVNDCDGDDPEDFCDDCNPCTVDANCTPCSSLAAAERSFRTCTEDAELSAVCAGPDGPRTGCVHAPLTTKTVQIDTCFPVADAIDLHAGVCDVGRCVENPN